MSGIRMDKAMKVFIARIISFGGVTQKELTDDESRLLVALRGSEMMERDINGRGAVEPTMELYFAAIACGIVRVNYDIKVDNGAPALVGERVDGISSWNPASRAMFTHSIAFGLASGRLTLRHQGRNVYQVVES